jgi:hypothetical protein
MPIAYFTTQIVNTLTFTTAMDVSSASFTVTLPVIYTLTTTVA